MRPAATSAVRSLLAASLVLAGVGPVSGQNPVFLSQGKIEFERRVNLYAQMDQNDSWSDIQKKTMPHFKNSYFDLLFTPEKTLYRPGRENPDNTKLYEQPAEQNIVWSDLAHDQMVSQKKIFESSFLVQDSTRQIKWKITDENRVIAGFNCRRANAVIMDSIYVVAFYTDEILTSGGPESFSGLPGMILGIALPHQHVTWFATRVEAVKVDASDLNPPVKGKKVDSPTLKSTLKESLKNFDRNSLQRDLEAAML